MEHGTTCNIFILTFLLSCFFKAPVSDSIPTLSIHKHVDKWSARLTVENAETNRQTEWADQLFLNTHMPFSLCSADAHLSQRLLSIHENDKRFEVHISSEMQDAGVFVSDALGLVKGDSFICNYLVPLGTHSK